MPAPRTPSPDHLSPDRQARPRAAPWRPEAWVGTVVQLARTEAVGGVLFTVMVIVALLWVNLPAHSSYAGVWGA